MFANLRKEVWREEQGGKILNHQATFFTKFYKQIFLKRGHPKILKNVFVQKNKNLNYLFIYCAALWD